MEQNFGKITLGCLDTAVEEVRTAEQTQELRLMDELPDIGQVLGAWGQPVLRGKQWRPDSVSFSGGMMVWVLYAPEEGGGPRWVDTWVPFQHSWELPEGTKEGTMGVRCLTRFTDARPLSPRKLLVRAGMSVFVSALSEKDLEIHSPRGTDTGIETLKRTYPLRLRKEAGEKSFQIDEEITLTEGKPESLVCWHFSPMIGEKKVLSSRLVLRGTGHFGGLVRWEDGSMGAFSEEVPFAQYAELGQSHGEGAQAEVLPAVTGLEAELTQEGRIALKCGMTAQYVISDVEPITLAEDAYAPGREVKLEKTTLEVPVVLESRRESFRPETPGTGGRVVAMDFLPDFPRQSRGETGVELQLAGVFQGLTQQGETLGGHTSRWEGKHRLNAGEGCRLMAIPQSAGDGSFHLDLTATAVQRIPMVTSAQAGEPVKQEDGPSLILRRCGEGGLWEAAKGCGSTMAAIRRANGLEGEPEPGRMLLIPVGQ